MITHSNNVIGTDSERAPSGHNLPRSPYTVDTIRSEQDLFRIREDWDRLSISASQPNVFTTFDWYEAWYRHFNESGQAGRLRPNVFVVRKDGVISDIAPLTSAEISKYGVRLRRLQFVGRNHEWDYNDLLVGENLEENVDVVITHLAQTQRDWELLDLIDVRDTNNSAECIQSMASKAGLFCALLPAEERCPYMRIDSGWDEMLSHRSRATRHSFRNRESKLQRFVGEGLRLRILDAPHTEPGLMERMVALEAQKRSNGSLSVPFLGQYSEVFESVFKRLGPKGCLCIALLESNDRLLSWHLLFRCGSKLWGYLTAYDHEFAKLSPGSMLIPAIVDYGFAHGFTEYDFLSGEEAYKLQWANGFNQRKRILIWNGRWKSRLYAEIYRRMRTPKFASRKNGEPEGFGPSAGAATPATLTGAMETMSGGIDSK